MHSFRPKLLTSIFTEVRVSIGSVGLENSEDLVLNILKMRCQLDNEMEGFVRQMDTGVSSSVFENAVNYGFYLSCYYEISLNS